MFIAATGGTIAGVQKSVEQHGYTAGELGIEALVNAVPRRFLGFDLGDWSMLVAGLTVVPTANPIQLTIPCESVIIDCNGRSLQVDLVRRGRTVPVAGRVAS